MYAKIITDISAAAGVIKEGRVVAFPTGTSYGLAADALQGHALQRVRNLKLRPNEKTFTVFVQEKLLSDFFTLTSAEEAFLAKYKNQPLTLLLQPKEPLLHLAQDGRVGLRVIDHPIMRKLAEAMDVPLTATSANRSGQDPCYDTACVTQKFPGLLDAEILQHLEPEDPAGALGTTYDLSLGCILDGGTLPPDRISTIVKLAGEKPIIVRPGTLQLSQN